MGADGGAIMKRSELVKTIKENKEEDVSAEPTWENCQLSGELLSEPIVSDYKGFLYNKKSILEYLLGINSIEAENISKFSHIKQLRDVVELHREFQGDEWVDSVDKQSVSAHKTSKGFGYIVECGHVLPLDFLKRSDCCYTCESSFEFYVIINPSTDISREHNLHRMQSLLERGKTHNLRQMKRQDRTKKRSFVASNSSKRKKSET